MAIAQYEQDMVDTMSEAERLERESLAIPRPAFPILSSRPCVFCSEASVPLPEKYVLTKYDVINGRGRKCYNHVGNRRFRQMAALNLKRYYEAAKKANKSMVVICLIQAMRESCPSGGFLKMDTKRSEKEQPLWISIGGRETREKVGHCMRDMIAAMREDDRRRDQYDMLNANKSCPVPQTKPTNLPTTMSAEQHSILQLLETGFEGRAEDLFRKKNGHEQLRMNSQD